MTLIKNLRQTCHHHEHHYLCYNLAAHLKNAMNISQSSAPSPTRLSASQFSKNVNKKVMGYRKKMIDTFITDTFKENARYD